MPPAGYFIDANLLVLLTRPYTDADTNHVESTLNPAR